MSNKVSKSNISKKSLYKLITFNVVMLVVGSYIGYMMARAKNFLSVSLKLSHIDTVTELIKSDKLEYYYEKYNISSSLQFIIKHWDIFNPLLLTSLIMIIIVFVYGNYINLFQKNPVTIFFDKNKELDMDTYYNALDACSVKKAFAIPVNMTTEQLKRFSNKEIALSSMLNNYFTEGEMTYDKFHSIIGETKDLFLDNVKRIINRINIFDDEEYNALVRNFGQDLRGHIDEDSKIKIYLEHIDYVDDLVKQNKEILTKFDTLLLELSKLDAIDSETFEQLQAIEDINNLISSTKYYKN